MLGQTPTHEEAVNMVKAVFEQIGGTVAPPRRPRHIDKYELMAAERDNFMMDFENACLSQNWDNSKKPFPTGRLRHTDAEWAAMIKTQVYPHSSEIDWEEYSDWIFFGGGDEWFLEEEDEQESIEEDEPEVKMENDKL